MRIYGNIETAGTSASGWVSNMKLSYSGGTVKIVGVDGDDLSPTNPAQVNISHGSVFKKLIFTSSPSFDDDTATSDIAGVYFHTTSGNAWGNDLPFYVYATYDTLDNPYIFISPCPNLTTISSNTGKISYHNTVGAVQDNFSIFVWSATVTPANLVSQPCMRIGAIAMTKVVTTDDWTLVNLNAGPYGIGRSPASVLYTYPTGNNGAGAASYIRPNGGTAPIFATQSYFYKVHDNGLVSLYVSLSGDGGTDGSGAVDLRLTMPYVYIGNGENRNHSSARIQNATNSWFGVFRPIDGSAFGSLMVNNTVNSITTVNNSDFPNGDRLVAFEATYRAF